jgi:hypothetical protein
MKKKNGFVFIETMIVVVVLISLLLVIYSSYTGLISVERKKARYDDPSFIYKTYAVGQFLISLKDDEGNVIIKNKIENKSNSDIIHISMNDIELFTADEDDDTNGNIHRKDFFNKLYNQLHIQDVLILSKSKIKKLQSNTNEISNDLYSYLSSLDISEDDDSQFYLVIMYAEKVNGNQCNPNELISETNNENSVLTNIESSCTFYYSSLKLEGEE